MDVGDVEVVDQPNQLMDSNSVENSVKPELIPRLRSSDQAKESV